MGRIWLITGASGGLGRAFAGAALQAGDRVLCAARKKESLSDLVQRFPKQAYPLAMDVTNEESVAAALAEGVAHWGSLDVVVNNAGAGTFAAVEELTVQSLQDQFNLNTLGAFRVIKAALPILRKQRSGHIINISSMSGFVGEAGSGAYNITKFALEGMSEALAKELAPLGIRVTIVEPGPFRTDFGKAAKGDAGASSGIADYAETSGKIIAMMKDIGQWAPGDPHLAGQAIVSLVESSQPPLRLVLGEFALKTLREKLAQVASDFERWEQVSLSTDVKQAQLA